MKNCQTYAIKNGYLPRISFKETPKATVKLISDEEKTIKDQSGETISGVSIKVLHDGTEKEIFTSSISLISKLAKYEEGDVITIEMKSMKTPKGFKSFYDVSKEGDEPEMDIPVVETDEPLPTEE